MGSSPTYLHLLTHCEDPHFFFGTKTSPAGGATTSRRTGGRWRKRLYQAGYPCRCSAPCGEAWQGNRLGGRIRKACASGGAVTHAPLLRHAAGSAQGRNLDVTPSAKGGRIRIGPAGWSYKDWAGVVYPAPKPRCFNPLSYVAGYFDSVEINSTFYRPALARNAHSWLERVEGNPEFHFTVKLWKRFTHERKEA